MPVKAAPPPPGLLDAMGISGALFCGTTGMDLLVEVESHGVLVGLNPDFGRLACFEGRGVMATCSGNENYDFFSRFFAPAVGINEDPVTGSAHCALGPYWCKRLKKQRFHARQESARGGVVEGELAGERVLLKGNAITMGVLSFRHGP